MTNDRKDGMLDARRLRALLDSLKHPLLFADTQHIIRYMNRAAESHYERGRDLIGTSLLDCHNSESQAVIREIFLALQQGLEERMITDDENHRIYMRAVRDEAGKLLGYYERFEPPKSSP